MEEKMKTNKSKERKDDGWEKGGLIKMEEMKGM
jgi:hypothetical protein